LNDSFPPASPSLPRTFRWRGAAGWGWQLALVVVAWLYLCALHWDNDGLWFQGDAARHAANGLFWKDFLTSGSLDPKGYALSYYARYPVINPTAYPPVFYLLEGMLFGLLGPSPYVAKGLVLLFALLAALYMTAWLRRWVRPEAGVAGAILILLSGMVPWAHVIMLNVPAMALGLAGLYHARCWLESPPASPHGRHLYAAAGLMVLAVLTYVTAGVVVIITLAWLVVLRRWRLLWQPRTLLTGLLAALLLLPWAWVIWYGAPTHLTWAAPRPGKAWSASAWGYYLHRLPELVDPYVLALAAVGLGAGLARRRWREDTLLLGTWVAVCYIVFSLMNAKETRYLLLAVPPLLCLGARGLLAAVSLVEAAAKPPAAVRRLAVPAALGAWLLAQAALAFGVRLPSMQGFREVVAFVEQVAPAEAVFYDGYHNGVFSFHVQAGDPDYRRRVVLGSKLLYATGLHERFRLEEFVASPGEVVEVLRTRGGCRWLAVEVSRPSERVAASRLLREAVQGPEFELVRSFLVAGLDVQRVDLYRLELPLQTPDGVELPFPILGKQTRYTAQPIQR
jgi:hypothetical protein